MSHTPVMADARHRFQVILQGSIVEPEHVRAYEEARKGEFGCARWQVFHAHQDMEKIGLGEVSLLPKSAITYSPDGVREIDVPGLPTFETPVRIDRVLHFHRFEPEDKYPSDGLTYILYGDARRSLWTTTSLARQTSTRWSSSARRRASGKARGTMNITIPSKRIQEVSKQLPRVAYLDNAFHLAWLPPAGLTKPADPLIRRDESARSTRSNSGTAAQARSRSAPSCTSTSGCSTAVSSFPMRTKGLMALCGVGCGRMPIPWRPPRPGAVWSGRSAFRYFLTRGRSRCPCRRQEQSQTQAMTIVSVA